MRNLYIILAAFLFAAALPAAVSAAGQPDAAAPAAERQSTEAAKKATMEKLERQEDKQSTVEYLDDTGLTTKVKAKFLAEKGLDSLDIKVVTVDGIVTLMGSVDKADQIALAEKAAREVEGVRKVNNELTVKSAAVKNTTAK